ncbi:hypothetical protein QAD02_009325 [Eretmocerus hayati]|uniref:Uncharacterized protein n=1 Tax=Eretmocerus hayati TaxID=131215 RepID=A0ACC2NBC9_9HYME|nr:hypothetical protein QAD02_009325 [Eretmocerus hayati]
MKSFLQGRKLIITKNKSIKSSSHNFYTLLDTVQGKKGFGNGEQDWGYVDVRPGAHMFWWLYYTTNTAVSNYYDKPLLIWLQGGPGASSTGFGNFEELGPLDINLNARNHTWVKNYNVLFIDNPVGTGFSYVDKFSALTTNNNQIAKDLVELMRAFYKEFPKFKTVPTYILCESYGGKMSAEWALEWYKAQKSGTIESNLKGVGLGDSWISPIDSVLTWAPYLWQTGLVDTTGLKAIEAAAKKTEQAVKAGLWKQATMLWGITENVINSVTNGIDFYNILTKMGSDSYASASRYADFNIAFKFLGNRSLLSSYDDLALERLMNGQVRKALNLNVKWGAQNGNVFSALQGDFMKPVTSVVERLLDETNLKIFIYSGQLDLIVDTPGTLLWTEKLQWRYAKQWRLSDRFPLVADGIIEGFFKRCNNLSFYWVNRAGHMVPADNPAAMAKILEHLIQK